MQAIRARNATFHISDQGERGAPAVVFVNSLGTDLRIWDAVVDDLSPTCRCIRYDARGQGLSDTAAGAFGIDDHVADLAAILDGLGCRPVALVGLSVGGQIALRWAAKRPIGLKALVLCDTAPRIGTAEAWNTRIAAVAGGGMMAIADAVLERWFPPSFASHEPDRLALMRNMLLRTSPSGYTATCAAIRDADLTAHTTVIDVPTLCLAGSEDQATPPALVQAMAADIPGARFVAVPGAGHLPCVDAPQAVSQHIGALLQEVGLG